MEFPAQPPASERACSIESHQEIEETLHSLRSLICDLLRENQELRTALLAERPKTSRHKRLSSPRII